MRYLRNHDSLWWHQRRWPSVLQCLLPNEGFAAFPGSAGTRFRSLQPRSNHPCWTLPQVLRAGPRRYPPVVPDLVRLGHDAVAKQIADLLPILWNEIPAGQPRAFSRGRLVGLSMGPHHDPRSGHSKPFGAGITSEPGRTLFQIDPRFQASDRRWCTPSLGLDAGLISRSSRTPRRAPRPVKVFHQEPRPMIAEPVLESVLTCPMCGHSNLETMPTDACRWFYTCLHCQATLHPKAGDCCVFCSYGSVPCPPIQAHGKSGGPCCGNT